MDMVADMAMVMGISRNSLVPQVVMPRIARLLCRVLVASLMLMAGGAVAGKWDVTPRLDMNLVVTDNVQWEEPGKEESEVLGRVAPGIRVEGKGRRLMLDMDYQPEAILFLLGTRGTRVYHKGRGGMKSELVDDWFYFDAAASAGQRILSEEKPLPLNNLGFSTNLTNFVSYSANPYLRHDFGGVATGLLSYSKGAIKYDKASISDADTRYTRASLTSGRHFQILSWRLAYREEDIRRPTSYDVFYSDANASANWRLIDKLSLVGQIGYTENDTKGRILVINGSYWTAGVLWHPSRKFSIEAQSGNNLDTGTIAITPSSRTKLFAIYENRSVGVNLGPRWRWKFEHRTRKTTWSGSYFEDTRLSQQRVPYTGNSILITPGTFELRDPVTGRPIYCTGIDVSDCFTLSDEAFKRYVGRFSVKVDTARSTFSLHLSGELRDYLETEEDRRINGLAGVWDWQMGKRTSSQLLLSLTDHSSLKGNRSNYLRQIAQLNFTRKLGSRKGTHAVLGFRHLSQVAEGNAPHYQENRIAAEIRMVF